MKTVAVGMSGGVDSAVSAYLLKKGGFSVFGLFMNNWEEEDGSCSAAKDFADVAAVCELLDIPYYGVNLAAAYKERVFAEFLRDLEAGLTPNPDVLCNREIKFDLFLEKALVLGADLLATGHYCRLTDDHLLLKGSDPLKDQSYFLHAVDGNALEKVVFPIGHLTKKEVRQIAKEINLPVAKKKDSTGICFIGKRDFKSFLTPYLGIEEGPFKTLDGKTVGTHQGAFYYTVGQRRGLGLGGEGEAWFVVAKKENVVYVERGVTHPQLFASSLTAKNLSWIAKAPPAASFAAMAKIRYRQQDEPCHVTIEKGVAHVTFDAPQRAITPGQSVVFYQGDLCLGGGKIE